MLASDPVILLSYISWSSYPLAFSLFHFPDNHTREKRLLVDEIVQFKKQNEMLQREIRDRESEILTAREELNKGSTALSNAEHQIQILKAQVSK